MKREVGNPLNLERLTGELYYQPVGTVGYINLGDVVMFKETPETDTVSGKFHTRAATEREVRRDTKSTTMKWDVECQERTPDNEAILLHGKVGAQFQQAAVAVAETVTVNGVVKRRVYELGTLSVKDVTAKVGVADKIVGEFVDGEISPANADVVVDRALGTIYIPETTTIADAADVDITFKADAVTMETITEIGQHTIHLGTFKLVAFDGKSTPARKIVTFDGQIIPKERGENKTEDFNKFSFEVIATGDVSMRVA